MSMAHKGSSHLQTHFNRTKLKKQIQVVTSDYKTSLPIQVY